MQGMNELQSGAIPIGDRGEGGNVPLILSKFHLWGIDIP
jgi:hypothetical protein